MLFQQAYFKSKRFVASLSKSPVTKVFNKYPNITGRRIVEGGLRCHNIYKIDEQKKPLITVITVCLNSEKTINECIESVLNQSYSNIEYIIVDGVSTDTTIQIIETYRSYIDYYISEPDLGLYHAINKGLMLSRGSYILVLNSDDWYSEDCIELLLATMINQDCDIACGLANYVDVNGRYLYTLNSMPYDEGIRLKMPLRHETMLIPATVYNAIGFYSEDYTIISDYELILRLYNSGIKIYEIQQPVLYFRNTGVSNTEINLLIKERYKLLKKIFPSINNNDVEQLAKIRIGTFGPQDAKKMIIKYKDNNSLVDALLSYADEKVDSGDAAWNDIGV